VEDERGAYFAAAAVMGKYRLPSRIKIQGLFFAAV
jgi:hypothetical protein